MATRNLLPNSASILVTENCNLACKYCFEHHNMNIMTKETVMKALEYLCNNAVQCGDEEFHAMIFGGEPLLNIEAIECLLEEGYRLGKEKGVRFSANMVTNATIMNDHIFNVLRKWRDLVNLNIQLSVDGIPSVHDAYRITKSGQGSWKLVEKNIPIFQKLYDNNPLDRRLSIHGCVNHKTLPYLYDSYKFFRDNLGFNQVWFLAIAEENWTNEDIEIYKEQNTLIYNDIVERLRNSKKLIEADYYAPFDKWRHIDSPRALPCSAGRKYVTITANGSIYPCHQIYFNDPHHTTKIGDIFTGIDEELRKMFVEYDEGDIYGCQGCPNNNCYRCLAANWMVNGAIFSTIRNKHCAMTAVEHIFQRKLKEEVEKLGLFNNHNVVKEETDNNLPDCLCNTREGNYPIIHNQENCQSGNNPDNPDCLCDVRVLNEEERTSSPETHEEKIDVIMDALELILLKLQEIDKKIK